MSEYSGICAAAAMSDGFVVASCGLNSLMALKAPVSETTVVMLRSCSSTTFAMMNSCPPSFYNLSRCLVVKMRAQASARQAVLRATIHEHRMWGNFHMTVLLWQCCTARSSGNRIAQDAETFNAHLDRIPGHHGANAGGCPGGDQVAGLKCHGCGDIDQQVGDEED